MLVLNKTVLHDLQSPPDLSSVLQPHHSRWVLTLQLSLGSGQVLNTLGLFSYLIYRVKTPFSLHPLPRLAP